MPQARQLFVLSRQAVHRVAIDAASFAVEVRKQLPYDAGPARMPPDITHAVDAPVFERIRPPQDRRAIQLEVDVVWLQRESIRMLGFMMVEGIPRLHCVRCG